MDEYETIKQLARELRKNQTGAEEMLWQKLRNRKPDGYKFLNAPLSILFTLNVKDFGCIKGIHLFNPP